MTHADTLRDMAKDRIIAGADDLARTLLAGAAALDTLDRVRDALAKIDRNGDAAEESAWAFSNTLHIAFERGRVDAYRHAHLLITRALGDTP